MAAVVEDLRAPLDVLAQARIGVLEQVRAVELREAVRILREVRRHPVHEHADAGLVQPVDEALEVVRRAVARGRREVPEHLVAPRAVERMLGDADQLDVRIAEVVHVRDQLIGNFVPGEERRLAMPRAAPRAGMQLVDVDRRAQRIPGAAPRQPLAVVPVITADVRDYGRIVRPQLHLKRERVSLELDVAVCVVDLEFVKRARADVRHERLPHARVGAPLHDVAVPVPMIEVADDADAPRVRRPHREARAAHAVALDRVRAELAMDVVVVALAEQVEIEVGEVGGGHEKRFYNTGLMPQMLSAYSRTLRSLEKGPMLSALITDLRVHSSGFANSASTRCCAAA